MPGRQFATLHLNEDDLFASPKFVCLRKLLPELVGKGHRILIFSVWTNCLDLLTCLLDHMDMSYLRMEGSTPVSERQGLIDRFNRDRSIPIFLLSTKACGLGINLVRGALLLLTLFPLALVVVCFHRLCLVLLTECLCMCVHDGINTRTTTLDGGGHLHYSRFGF